MARSQVILDTDLVIDFLRGFGQGLETVRSVIREGHALVTAITVYELQAGVRTESEQDAVAAFCSPRTIPFTRETARRAGELARALRAAGSPIGVADTLIAGSCVYYDYALATGNARHFSRVPGLRLHSLI